MKISQTLLLTVCNLPRQIDRHQVGGNIIRRQSHKGKDQTNTEDLHSSSIRELKFEFLQWRTASWIELAVSTSNTLFPLPCSALATFADDLPTILLESLSPLILLQNFNNTNHKYFLKDNPNSCFFEILLLCVLWAASEETGTPGTA